MKVTPVFHGFDVNDYAQEYCKFIQEYNDIFREVISLQQLLYIKKVILCQTSTLPTWDKASMPPNLL